ncbi:MAG TPA: PfkB family carbohydrate kinase [candidate division Zixibacteria bacterium]|jgi:sugar/nucleoside kinase (ribokinase family)
MLAAYGNPVYDVIRTPWVETRGRVLSGCATNAALVYARLGGTVHVTGRSGRDHLADYSAVMALDGIVTQTEPCAQTGGFRLTYDAQGRRDLQVLGVAEPIGAANDAIDDADFVFIGPVMQETPFDLIRDIRHRTDATMLLDPQGLLRRIGKDGFIEHFKPEGIEAICALFDIVKPNELETETLTGIDPRRDLDGAASMLKSWGIPTVVITLAELGSYIVNDEGSWRIQAIPTCAIDSTGAGDSYAGGLMYARSVGINWADAGRLATAVSSTMIRSCGPEFSMTRSAMDTLSRSVVLEASAPALSGV